MDVVIGLILMIGRDNRNEKGISSCYSRSLCCEACCW